MAMHVNTPKTKKKEKKRKKRKKESTFYNSAYVNRLYSYSLLLTNVNGFSIVKNKILVRNLVARRLKIIQEFLLLLPQFFISPSC